jgi:hypothetical protein
MSPRFVIVREVVRQDASQVGLVEHDQMIQTISANRAGQSFNVWRLPRRPIRDDNLFNVHMVDTQLEVDAVGAVMVAEQETRCFVIRKRLGNLLARRRRGRMTRHIEVHHASSVVSQYDEAAQQLKTHGSHDEEIDRGNVRYVILRERPPRLRRRLAMPNHVLRHRCFFDRDSQQGQLGLNLGRAPRHILA